MRGLHTPVSELRKNVFVEIAKIAFDSEHIQEDLEALPYKLSPTEKPLFRSSIFQERAVCAERARLAMGLSLRPANEPVHITEGLESSAIEALYYEPPLMQVKYLLPAMHVKIMFLKSAISATNVLHIHA